MLIDDPILASLRTSRADGPFGGARNVALVGRDVRLLPGVPGAPVVRVRLDDAVILSRTHEPSEAARENGDGPRLHARIACNMPDELRFLHAGHRVRFARSEVTCVVVHGDRVSFLLRVIRCPDAGGALRGGEAIDMPDLPLTAPVLTAHDLATLTRAARHADVVIVRSVRCDADVDEVRKRLAVLGRPDMEIRAIRDLRPASVAGGGAAR